MLRFHEPTPAAQCWLAAGRSDPAGLLDLLFDPRLLNGNGRRISPELTETLRLALLEILHSVFTHSEPVGAEEEGEICLWLEPSLLICSIRFAGTPLPGWLLANWDRAREPGRLAGQEDGGWGWLLVRDAIDTVSYERTGTQQLLFLEKRF